MEATKKMFRNFPEHMLYFAASNLISMFTALIINVLVQSILIELARGDADKEALYGRILSGVFALLFFAVFAVLLCKSPGMRNRYLAETLGRDYHFGQDLADFVKGSYLTGIVAYALFTLPFTIVMAIFPDLPYLPLLFYPQDALIDVVGNAFAAWGIGIAVYAVFTLVYFPILHAVWEKNRIHRG